MTGARVPDEMETGELAVHIVSDKGAKDHVLLLARASRGRARARVASGNWATGPEESVVSASALLTRLDDVVRSRQRMEPDVRVVRSWLTATPR